LKIQNIFKSFLPGIFLIGYNIGTGSVTSMAKAGANYGMELLWTVIFSCIITYYLIQHFGKFTIVTGESAMEAFRKHIHPGVGLFLIVTFGIIVIAASMGLMGIISNISYEWSKSLINGGIKPIVWAVLFSSLIYILLWYGNTKTFEKALAFMVAIMGAAFIINFFIVTPSFKVILKGCIPTIPDVTSGSDNSPFLVIASMVGTTVSSILLIMRSFLVKEENWTLKDLDHQKKDAKISATMMFLISATIMAAGAGTLFIRDIPLNNASEMVNLLEPIAGKAAVSLFVIGIVSAGVSSQFPNILTLPWLITDYISSERNMKKPAYRIILFLIALTGLVVPIFNAKPVFIMLLSQACLAAVLPVTVSCVFYLTNKKSLMNSYVNELKEKIILSVILIFSFMMSGIGIYGLIQDLM
jgi:manganese transport protein